MSTKKDVLSLPKEIIYDDSNKDVTLQIKMCGNVKPLNIVYKSNTSHLMIQTFCEETLRIQTL